MKKVGLVLACCTNYGALLQSFATQYVVRRMGFETEVIINNGQSSIKDIKFDWGLFQFFIEGYIQKKHNKRIIEVNDQIHKDNKTQRHLVMLDFCERRLVNRCFYNSYKELQAAGASCDAVLLGSDQMWYPGTTFGNHISLRFVPDNVRKISYATSLGVSEYPKYCWNSARNVWKRMDFLSVREEQGKKIIQEICGNIDVKVVLDPTYLLTKEEWYSIIPDQSILEGEYVLCYFLGNDVNSLKCARRFADSKKLKLVSILSDESSVVGDTTIADKIIVGESPEGFVNLIRHASYVFTDSFHGTAFSVINDRQFFVLYRKNELVKHSRNSRIDNILKMWNIQDRLIQNKSVDWNETQFEDIDYQKVKSLIDNKRNYSLSYLKDSLDFNENI